MGGYYEADFRGFGGVTQGDPLSLIILDVVMEAVMNHCILLVAGGAGGKGRCGMEVLHCTEFFYAYNRLVASTYPVWLQGEFYTLTGLFGWCSGNFSRRWLGCSTAPDLRWGPSQKQLKSGG